jgi:ribosomal protein S18 acetylase RimI-like enzyme
MPPRIRPFTDADLDAVLDLSIRAWTPVFAAVADVLAGSGVFEVMHPDWRADQRRAVRAACTDPDLHTWVAEADGTVAGFVVARLHADDAMGEIYMIAVDPDVQRRGVGAALTAFATGWFAEQGMAIALIQTGQDAGHAPARRVYERAGYTALPSVQYFKKL